MQSKENCYLNLLLLSQLMINLLDQLAGTKLYRHDLKRRIKFLMPELEKVIDGDLNLLCSVKSVYHGDIYRLMDYQESVIQRLGELKPQDYGIVAEILREYLADPEYFFQKMEISIIDTSEKIDEKGSKRPITGKSAPTAVLTDMEGVDR